jgi:hypothetical protein
MVDKAEPLRTASDPDDRPIVEFESLLARFLIQELESSDHINDLLALFEGSQQSVARRLAVRAAGKWY